jgi:hypothetical protein
VVVHKCRDFQSVTGKRAGNAVGTETAILVRVKSPYGLHPTGLGLRSLNQGVIRGRRPESERCRGEVESVRPRPNVTAANKEVRQ